MARESTEDEEAKATIDSLRRDVQEELALHSSVMQVCTFHCVYFPLVAMNVELTIKRQKVPLVATVFYM